MVRPRLTAALTAVLALALGGSALAQPYYHHHDRRHAYYRCRAQQRRSANTGTVIGAVVGGLGGNALSHGGGRMGGTLIGAGVGAVAGHEIAKNGHRC